MRYLITGGTGTFGSAFVERLLNNTEDEIIVLSRDEAKQFDMKQKINDSRVKFIIGNIRNKEEIRSAFANVDYVFHTAALKQVPSCQENPLQAVMTNVIGFSNVLDLCIENNVKKMIYLSTDKAVEPTSVMGMTKSISEEIAKNRAKECNTKICITRFGNIAMSRGSVIPTFIEQAKKGEPLTVTSEDMERYIMSLDDAIDLVTYAFEQGESGKIYIKKANVYNIKTVAECVINLLNSKSEIRICGVRAGEKLNERLYKKEESVKDNGDFLVIGEGCCENNKDYYSVADYKTTLKDVKKWLKITN